jgi:hypothetical protein
LSKRVIEMERSAKVLAGAKDQYGVMKSLEAFYQRVTKISLQNALPYEMFANGLPYEASKTYRIMKSEIECKRSLAMVEAHRQALSGF